MKTIRSNIGSNLKRAQQRGVAAVEFAFVLIFMLMIVAGIIEFGRAFWYYNALDKATRDGARYMSTVPKDQLISGVSTAQDLVVGAANTAALRPAIIRTNVTVTCLPNACSNGTAPTDVTVAITGYNITIGGLIPFFLPQGGTTTYTRTLSPYTTMRYMK
jgi:Flp pilus assembly protein TadG